MNIVGVVVGNNLTRFREERFKEARRRSTAVGGCESWIVTVILLPNFEYTSDRNAARLEHELKGPPHGTSIYYLAPQYCSSTDDP